jgi:hypothetical protein
MGNRTRDDARGSAEDSPADEGSGHRWFVVANASRGQAWIQRIGARGYDRVRDWDDPGARMAGRTDKDQQLEYQGSVKAETARDAHDLPEAMLREITAALRSGEATGIYLIAPAQLLPRLREGLPADLRDRLMGEETSDLTQVPRGELFGRLDALRRGEAVAGPERGA